jgi:hypothetical protein
MSKEDWEKAKKMWENVYKEAAASIEFSEFYLKKVNEKLKELENAPLHNNKRN